MRMMSLIFSARHRRRVGTAFLVVNLLTATCLALQPSPELAVDSVNVGQEGVVSFSVLALGLEKRANFPDPQFLVGQTDDRVFRLYEDVDSIQQVRFNAFTFTVYLVTARDPGSGAYKFQVTGNPTGSFHDAAVRVSFHVKTGSNAGSGEMLMPVYNAVRKDFLQVEKSTGPTYVSVSGLTSAQIRLANPPDALPVSLTNISVGEDCPQCWTRVTSAVNQNSPLRVDPGATTNVSLDLLPNSVPALLQGAEVIKPDLPHDTLAVTITYHTVPGGADRKQTVLAPVRFGPGLFGLGLALLGGLALGLVARYLLTGRLGKQDEKIVHAILTALVLAIIAEFVGMMLTAYGNSKLILFGLDIDPRQLFPAFILAMLVGGGSAVVSWVKELVGKPA